MFLQKNKWIVLSLLLLLSFVTSSLAQKNDGGQGSVSQRLEVMRQKLETMRRSLGSAASVLSEENKEDKSKKEDKSNLETPLGRLKGLEKETSNLQSEVNSLRGKNERAEKYEAAEVDRLETAVGELRTRVDSALLETASARANPESPEGKAR